MAFIRMRPGTPITRESRKSPSPCLTAPCSSTAPRPSANGCPSTRTAYLFPALFFLCGCGDRVFVSAWLPVRRASRLPIKDIVLGTVEEKHIPRPLIVGIGIVLFIVSALLPHFASGTMLYLAGGFSLLGLIAATILVIPIFTNIASAGLERFYGAVAGNEGRIAARNMKDNKNVTQNITLLFISISAIIAIRVVGNFVTTYISDVFHGAELQGFADGHMKPEFVEQVKEMDGAEKVLPLYVFKNNVQGNREPISRLEGNG